MNDPAPSRESDCPPPLDSAARADAADIAATPVEPLLSTSVAAPEGAAPPDPTSPPPIVTPPPVLGAAVAAPADTAGPAAEPFRFHGEAEEYFRIWIVNTLLTLVTLGVFFPWAKVRKRRYLRGSTELMGHRFDYRADPLRLLVGHVMVALFFLGYSVFGAVYPVVRWGVLLVGVALLPWIVVRSLTFNAHNTVYRGLRFRFSSSLSPAVSVFLLQPLLMVLTVGLYYPAWVREKRRLIISGHRLGDAYFKFEAALGRFYAAYFFGGIIVAAALFLGGFYLGFWVTTHRGTTPRLAAMLPFFALYGLGLWIGRHVVHAQLFNHIWNHTQLDDHRFVARMETGEWLGLQMTNLLAIIGTLGLLYPWSVVRSHRYTAEHLSFVPAGSVDGIGRLESGGGSATGDTAAEFVGLDFGI